MSEGPAESADLSVVNGNLVLKSNMDNMPPAGGVGGVSDDNEARPSGGQHEDPAGQDGNRGLGHANELENPLQVPTIEVSTVAADKAEHNSSVESSDPLLTEASTNPPYSSASAAPAVTMDPSSSAAPLLLQTSGPTLGDEVDAAQVRPSGMSARRAKSTKRPGMFARDRLTMKVSPKKNKIINEEDIMVHPSPGGEKNSDEEEEDEPAFGYADLSPEERDRTVSWFEAVEAKDEKAIKWLLDSGFGPNRHNQVHIYECELYIYIYVKEHAVIVPQQRLCLLKLDMLFFQLKKKKKKGTHLVMF